MATSASSLRLQKKTNAAIRARGAPDKHDYFIAVAQTRYIMRKVFRIVDEHAKQLGLDPLAHQALLQVYGSPNQALRVSALAERLDIARPFASALITELAKANFLKRSSDTSDMRVTIVRLTSTGRDLCHKIDLEARLDVDALISQLVPGEREAAISSLMFYVGPGATGRSPKRQNR